MSKDDLLFRIDAKDVEDNIQQLESNIRQQELNLRAAQLNLEDLLERQEDNQEENAKVCISFCLVCAGARTGRRRTLGRREGP